MQIMKEQVRRLNLPVFVILLFIGLVPGIASAQQKLSFQEIDRLTLESFNQGDWHEVVRVANIGYSLGIDYFYLRLRSGIALYNLEKFERAIRDFKKALGYSENDALTLEYLYYAYKGAGRHGEASMLIRNMPLSLKDRMIPADKSLFASAEGGAMFAGNKEEMLSFNPTTSFLTIISSGPISTELCWCIQNQTPLLPLTSDTNRSISWPVSNSLQLVLIQSNSLFLSGSTEVIWHCTSIFLKASRCILLARFCLPDMN